MATNASMTTTAVDFTTQRLSFVNKIGLILSATSDDAAPTGAHMYAEVAAISRESVGCSESLVEFLADRLRHQSPRVKVKVLKVVKHLVCDEDGGGGGGSGSSDVKLGLRRVCDAAIKPYTKYGGGPGGGGGDLDPHVCAAEVRSLAKEVCTALYNMDLQQVVVAEKSRGTTAKTKTPPGYGGGLGSSSLSSSSKSPTGGSGSLQGFGNCPVQHDKGFGDVILGGLEKLSAKMSETGADRQAALLASLELGASSSNYQPPPTTTTTTIVNTREEEEDMFSSTTTFSFVSGIGASRGPALGVVKKRQPGKAGGGWNDDDDDDESGDDIANEDKEILFPGQGESESTAVVQQRVNQSADAQQGDHWTAESLLVDEYLQRGSTGEHLACLPPSDTVSFCEKCSALNCTKVVEFIAKRLTGSSSGGSKDFGVAVRCLQLLEGIMYSRQELVSIDVLAATCRQDLVDCYQTVSQICESSSATCENDLTKRRAGTMQLLKMCKTKLVKVVLILQQLSKHQDKWSDLEVFGISPGRIANVTSSPV